ncbi:hypothetical protein L1887_61849 [Cichorium endivia]|nr:hypothetical protein L1887_61849 [Cichorium endivia]
MTRRSKALLREAAKVGAVQLRGRSASDGVVGVQVEVVEVLALAACLRGDLVSGGLDGLGPERVLGRVGPGEVEVEGECIRAVRPGGVLGVLRVGKERLNVVRNEGTAVQEGLRAVVLELADDQVQQRLAVLLQRDGVESATLTALDISRCALDEVEQRARLPIVDERTNVGGAEGIECTCRRSWAIVEGEIDRARLSKQKVEGGQDLGLGILARLGEDKGCIDELIQLVSGVDAQTAVDLTLGDRLETEVVDDAKPVSAAPDGPEEVGVLRGRCRGQGAVRKHNVCRDECVTSETVLVGLPAVSAAAGDEAADTDARDTTTDDSNASGFEARVDVVPHVAGADIDVALVTAQIDLLEVLEVDVHARCRGEALVRGVTGSFDGEADAFAADHLDRCRQVGRRGGHGHAGWQLRRRRHEVLDQAKVGEVECVDNFAALGGHGARDGLACVKLGRVDKTLLESKPGRTTLICARPVDEEGQRNGEAGQEGHGGNEALHLRRTS